MWISKEEHFRDRAQQWEGPEVGLSLVCWKHSREATVAGPNWVGGEEEEIRSKGKGGRWRVGPALIPCKDFVFYSR